ncbi:DUF2147 domain-containing protein [Chryseobacterium lathyri]|uniref:Uncharacterized protein (DUF2147 family) n=1 Tax=Chryseobacterium lathyri TaxID=395933 RepID=A0ABT9SQD7_9FLAO|nr:DUF2147 domain-containing protein [Chryseobacterium lathyri]MDP9961649.1 uncharacterized protein (DUF2147 family) [Chryseobacterium lathyri]
MKKIFFATVLLLVSIVSFAQQPADKIIGNWESIDGEVKLRFQIFKQEGKYLGKLLWASNMFEADGKTAKKDFNNPNKTLKTRSRQGIVNITNLKYDDDEYKGGKLYNPSDGDTYSLNAKLKSENELHFRGYLGISLLGKNNEI